MSHYTTAELLARLDKIPKIFGKLLDMDQTAEVFGVHESTVRRAATDGRLIVAKRSGTRWFFNRDELRDIIVNKPALVPQAKPRKNAATVPSSDPAPSIVMPTAEQIADAVAEKLLFGDTGFVELLTEAVADGVVRKLTETGTASDESDNVRAFAEHFTDFLVEKGLVSVAIQPTGNGTVVPARVTPASMPRRQP